MAPKKDKGPEKKIDFNVASFLDAHRQDYLADQQSAGGYKAEWKHAVDRDILKLLVGSDVRNADRLMIALREAMQIAADSRWEKEPPASQPSLFTVGGIGIEDHYNIPDPTVPGGHRRVLGRYATLEHVEMANAIRFKKLKDSEAAYARHVEAAARLRQRCGGNTLALLWDFRDGAGPSHMPPPTAPRPERPSL